MDYVDFNPLKNWQPFGPAPEGWSRIKFCSRIIPHNENAGYDTEWQDEEQNKDHYA